MRPIPLREFAALCGGVPNNRIEPAGVIRGFALDHREVRQGDLFLAIRGAKFDGHSVIAEAVGAGAVAALSEKPFEAPAIVVPDLVRALAAYASSIRNTFRGPVVGVTGSNGKTSAKEFLAAALSPLGPVLKSEGNRNTEYTAPLVWSELTQATRSVVAELGMRGFGQIEHLAGFTRPTVGLITMIGTAHIEMVGSREGIARAKAELLHALPTDGLAALWAEDDFLGVLRATSPCPVRTFGFSPDAECQITGYKALSFDRCQIMGRLGERTFQTELPSVGRHQALNAAAAIAISTALGVDLAEAAEAIRSVELPPMRLEPVSLRGATVLMDAYNASPDSTVAALRTLGELPAAGRRVAILGEMRELGDFSESGHRLVGRALAATGVDAAVLFGESTRFILEDALSSGMPPERLKSAASLEEIADFLRTLATGDLALVKGSRALGLEQALEAAR